MFFNHFILVIKSKHHRKIQCIPIESLFCINFSFHNVLWPFSNQQKHIQKPKYRPNNLIELQQNSSNATTYFKIWVCIRSVCCLSVVCARFTTKPPCVNVGNPTLFCLCCCHSCNRFLFAKMKVSCKNAAFFLPLVDWKHITIQYYKYYIFSTINLCHAAVLRWKKKRPLDFDFFASCKHLENSIFSIDLFVSQFCSLYFLSVSRFR